MSRWEKSFKIINHQEDENENAVRYQFTPVRIVTIKKANKQTKEPNAGKNAVTGEILYTVYTQPYGKQHEVLQKLKLETPYDLSHY